MSDNNINCADDIDKKRWIKDAIMEKLKRDGFLSE